MVTYYVGADVDSKMTELAFERGQEIVARDRVPTDIRSIRTALESIEGRKVMVIEEGCLAGWLYRNLRLYVDRFVVADPRRNRLVYDDGDKTDPLDAADLAALCRSHHVREVYHTEDQGRLALKEVVSLYHDCIRDAVRQTNKLRGFCLGHGLRVPRGVLLDRRARRQWLSERKKEDPAVGKQLEIRWLGLERTRRQVRLARGELSRRSKAYPMIEYWQELPGIGLIRAATLFAYLDTPWRFKTHKKLWKYCGLGLQRRASGTDKRGRPRAGYVHLFRQVNRRLKAMIQGAALSAIRQGDNPFAYRYETLVRTGRTASNARHAVGRKMLSVMLGMWKTSSRYNPSLV
jgi:transposase